MTNIYDIISNIKSFLRDNPIVNHVTFGDILEVALNKTEIYPLVHFTLGQREITSNTIRVTLELLFLEIVEYTKEYNENDKGDRQECTNPDEDYKNQL